MAAIEIGKTTVDTAGIRAGGVPPNPQIGHSELVSAPIADVRNATNPWKEDRR